MSIVKYPEEVSKEYIELCEKLNNDVVELLDDFVKIKGSFSNVRGSKSNLQFILLEDYIMEQEKRENEKGRYSFSTSLLNMAEDAKSKVNKNGLVLSLDEMRKMLESTDDKYDGKRFYEFYEPKFDIDSVEESCDKAFSII